MNINLTLIGQLIAFAIFVWFCMKFVWPPITNAMDARQKKIAEGLDAAGRAERDLKLAQEKATEMLRDTKKTAAGDITVLSNGLKTWTIIKEDKSVYESVASKDDENSINPKKLMTIWEKDFKNYFDKEETVGKELMSVIKLVPLNPKKADYHTILIYISKSDNDLKKAVMRFKNGTTKTYTLTNFTENAQVEDAKFVYDARKYPGYSVVKD